MCCFRVCSRLGARPLPRTTVVHAFLNGSVAYSRPEARSEVSCSAFRVHMLPTRFLLLFYSVFSLPYQLMSIAGTRLQERPGAVQSPSPLCPSGIIGRATTAVGVHDSRFCRLCGIYMYVSMTLLCMTNIKARIRGVRCLRVCAYVRIGMHQIGMIDW